MSICSCTPRQKERRTPSKRCEAHMGFIPKPPRKLQRAAKPKPCKGCPWVSKSTRDLAQCARYHDHAVAGHMNEARCHVDGGASMCRGIHIYIAKHTK